jgi:diguanylate cyclase (GGDEF)-like protein
MSHTGVPLEERMDILVVDDDLLSRHLVSAALRALGYTVREAANGVQAWEEIQRSFAPLLITDWQMPELDGPSLIRRVRTAELPGYVYAILLTVRETQTDRIAGLDSGADDYLIKPTNLDELRARVAIATRILSLERELRSANVALQQLNGQLQHQATHDRLTGLLNRPAILEHLGLELARVRRSGQPLSLALLDLDHFKQINDAHGHLVGDRALQHVAALFAQSLRRYDWVGRWGGEEFLMLLPATGLLDACRVAERVRASLDMHPLALTDGPLLQITASVGVTDTLSPDESIEELMTRADLALYAAKHAGRNRVQPSAGVLGAQIA